MNVVVHVIIFHSSFFYSPSTTSAQPNNNNNTLYEWGEPCTARTGGSWTRVWCGMERKWRNAICCTLITNCSAKHFFEPETGFWWQQINSASVTSSSSSIPAPSAHWDPDSLLLAIVSLRKNNRNADCLWSSTATEWKKEEIHSVREISSWVPRWRP